MIKYILWDIDGTLLNFDLAETEAVRYCFDEYGLGNCSDEQLLEYKDINIKYWERLERGEISKQEVLEGRFREFFSNHNIDIEIVAKLNSTFQKSLGEMAVFNDFGEEIVKKLNCKFRQFAVTNGTKTAQKGKLKNSGLDNILEAVFISDEVGFEKPRIEFFEKVFDYVKDSDKSKYLIIGDSLTSDIKGGNNVGIKTCWYNPNKKENNLNLKVDYEIKNLIEVLDILEKENGENYEK